MHQAGQHEPARENLRPGSGLSSETAVHDRQFRFIALAQADSADDPAR